MLTHVTASVAAISTVDSVIITMGAYSDLGLAWATDFTARTATTMTIMIIRTTPTPIMTMAAAMWCSGACSPRMAGVCGLSRSAADRDGGGESGGGRGGFRQTV